MKTLNKLNVHFSHLAVLCKTVHKVRTEISHGVQVKVSDLSVPVQVLP